MRLFAVLILGMLIFSIACADLSVYRDLPDEIGKNSEFTVEITVSPEKELDVLDIAEFIPENWEIKGWEINGYPESSVDFESEIHDFMGETYNMNHWNFEKPVSDEFVLRYTTTAIETGKHEFVLLWIYPGGFDKDESSINVIQTGGNSPSKLTGYAVNPQELEPAPEEMLMENFAADQTWGYIALSDMFSSLNSLFSNIY